MATYYWTGLGGATTWATLANWSTASAGATAILVAPTLNDDVIFDGGGISGSKNYSMGAAYSVKSFTITSGYTGTGTHGSTLTVFGDVTFGSNWTLSGAGAMVITGSSTLTFNGKTWPNNMTWQATGTTKSIVDTAVIGGNLTFSNVINYVILTGSLTVNGTCSLGNSTQTFSGSNGFTVGVLQSTILTTSGSLNLAAGPTYTVTNGILMNTSRPVGLLNITSMDPVKRAILTLRRGASCNLTGILTRIDASGGRPINTFASTVTDCINVNSYTDLVSVASSFVQV